MNPVATAVVSVLAVLAAVLLVIRWQLTAWLARVGQAAMAGQPDRIRLIPATPGVWRDPETPARLAAAFEREGFLEGGTFTVAEMPEVVVRLLGHPGEAMMAAIYQHPQAGTWVDCVSHHEDGTHVQVSTLPPTGLDGPPGCLRLSAPGLEPAALVARLRHARPDRPARPVRVPALAAEFERAYAEETAWRRQRGISGREVAEVAKRMKTAA